MHQISYNIYDFLMEQTSSSVIFQERKPARQAFRISNVFRAESTIDSICMNVQLATESFKRDKSLF